MIKRVFLLLVFFCLSKLFNAQNLVGTNWLLNSIDDLNTGISKDIGATYKATFKFDSDTSFSGKFCNAYSGRYKSDKEGHLKMGIPSRSKMLCMGIDKYEKEMMGLLPLANKYRIDKETLFIFTSAHKRLTFKKAQ